MDLSRRHLQRAEFRALIRLAEWLGFDTYPDLEAYDRRLLIIRQYENTLGV
jgi:hypothetical protein